ncbi:MAG: hypothetical protein JRN21_00530 [Nitrososphaerota archaeon]|nr:hypothetical protein [Nitrososphaerota archaeon]
MDLEAVVGDRVGFRKTMGDGPGDPRCQWAAKVEERAREIYKGPPDRIVFHYAEDGIRLLTDGESKVSLLIAVRELYGQIAQTSKHSPVVGIRTLGGSGL